MHPCCPLPLAHKDTLPPSPTSPSSQESGALDGLIFSTSKLFVSGLNWRAIHIEASPSNTMALRVNRPESVNIHAAVCDRTRLMTFVSKSSADAVGGLWELMPCVRSPG